jgi:hypothetical protein
VEGWEAKSRRLVQRWSRWTKDPENQTWQAEEMKRKKENQNDKENENEDKNMKGG